MPLGVRSNGRRQRIGSPAPKRKARLWPRIVDATPPKDYQQEHLTTLRNQSPFLCRLSRVSTRVRRSALSAQQSVAERNQRMGLSLLEGFTKSLAMTVLSEIGDKTFFAAAILAMRHPRRLVLAGCLTALIVMTILSVLLGWAAPNLISRKWTHHITTLLFFGFGLWSLWEGFTEEGEAEELAEVEAKLNADWKADTNGAKGTSKNADWKADTNGAKGTSKGEDLKKQQRPFLTQFFSPIFLKAFSITFFGEWGDKSQIATIGLASDANPFGVVLGGILGQALCTTAAVLGGKSLASQISEKMVALSSGVLFLVFGLQSYLSAVGESS